MKISSGSVLGPSQPPVPDSGALDKNNLVVSGPTESGGGSQAINFGNDAMSGQILAVSPPRLTVRAARI